MSLPVEAKNIGVGDYSTTKGTVTLVVEHKVPKTGELESLDIHWKNGETDLGVSPDAPYNVVQGWGSHYSSVRSGLAADHADDR